MNACRRHEVAQAIGGAAGSLNVDSRNLEKRKDARGMTCVAKRPGRRAGERLRARQGACRRCRHARLQQGAPARERRREEAGDPAREKAGNHRIG